MLSPFHICVSPNVILLTKCSLLLETSLEQQCGRAVDDDGEHVCFLEYLITVKGQSHSRVTPYA